MSSEQYRVGRSSVTPNQQTVTGYSTSWNTEVLAGDVYKPDVDTEPTAVIGSVDSATQLTLSSNWAGTTHTYQTYMIQRSWTPNLNYARPYQGDADLADLLREQIIDKLDTDVWDALHLSKYVKKGANFTIPSGCTFNWIIMTAGTTTTLPAATNSRIIRITKSSGNTLTATIQRAGSDTIEGNNKVFMYNQYDSVILGADGGTKWYEI